MTQANFTPRDEFADAMSSWKLLSKTEQRLLSKQDRRPVSATDGVLWAYSQAQQRLRLLVNGGIDWLELTEVDDHDVAHFQFGVVRAAGGRYLKALVMSAQQHLDETPEVEWSQFSFWVQRERDRAEARGLQQIIPIAATSYLELWNRLGNQTGIELRSDIVLAIATVIRGDRTWLVERLAHIQDNNLISIVWLHHLVQDPDYIRALVRSHDLRLAALGVHGTLRDLQNIARQTPNDLFNLELDEMPVDWVALDTARVRRERSLALRVGALIANFHDNTRKHMLVELLAWSAHSLPEEGGLIRSQQRQAAEALRTRVKRHAARAVAEILAPERTEHLIEYLRKQESTLALESVAAKCSSEVALVLRQGLLDDLEQRFVLDAQDDKRRPHALEREREYLKAVANALSSFSILDTLDLPTWFAERFALFPLRTRRRSEDTERWRRGISRASFLLVLGAWVLQRSSRVKRENLRQVLECELASRILDWEDHCDLGTFAGFHQGLETTAIMELTRVFSSRARIKIVAQSRTAWVMLVMLGHQCSNPRKRIELERRLNNDQRLLDARYTDHIIRCMATLGLWTSIRIPLERWQQLNPPNDAIFHGRVDLQDVLAKVRDFKLAPDPDLDIWRLEMFLNGFGSAWKHDLNSLDGFVIACTVLQQNGWLAPQWLTKFRNAEVLLSKLL